MGATSTDASLMKASLDLTHVLCASFAMPFGSIESGTD